MRCKISGNCRSNDVVGPVRKDNKVEMWVSHISLEHNTMSTVLEVKQNIPSDENSHNGQHHKKGHGTKFLGFLREDE